MYKTKIKRLKELVASNWSGGTTTQLAIYPQNAEYSKKDFGWRLSTAVVNCEESEFSSLPQISRVIMVIEGELTLYHDGHHSVILKPYQQDSFKGGWQTKSFGKARDFNLMFSEKYYGSLEAIDITDNSFKDITIESDLSNEDYTYKTNAFYCTCGKVEINFLGNEPITLNEGDLILIDTDKESERVGLIMRNFMLKNSKLVRAIIKY